MKAKTLLAIALFCFPAGVHAQTGNSGLDPSFGKGGILVDTSYRSYGDINDIKLRPDGKILVLSYGYSGTYVARYHPNGTVDNSFGTDGSRWIDSFAKPKGLNGIVCELQQDEKILIAGRTYEWIGFPVRGGFVLRLHPDGTIDSAFGNNGVQYSRDETSLLCLKPDGSILTAGEDPFDKVYVNGFKANGAVDSAFGIKGLFQIRPGSYPSLARLSVLADGRIALVGSVGVKVYYIRLLADGQQDTTFCGTGVCYTYGGWGSEDAIVYPNGEALVAIEWSVRDSPSLMRLKRTDATPDSSFGIIGDGLYSVPLPGFGIEKLLQSSDGRIICAGMWNELFTVVRVLKDGKGIDSTFGKEGIITTSLAGGHYERIYAAALQPDGKILAGGICRVLESNPRYWHHVAAIARYFSDARLGVMAAPQSAKGTLKVYPNPAKTSLNVVVPAPGLLQLFNSEGRLLRQQSCVGPAQNLDIASLPAGAYLLRLQTAYKNYSSLFIKE